MILDASFDFGLPTLTNSTTKTVSPNIFDAGADEVVFGGRDRLRLAWKAVITADAAPTILVEFVGSNVADLDANDTPEGVNNIMLGSSGVVRNSDDGTVLATGDVVYGDFEIAVQTVARRYYGVLTTLGGTNPDIVTTTCYAHIVRDAQTNMPRIRAAVPA